jgi:phage baseplate assembly protein gpV
VLPLLVDVPVIFPRGGGFTMTFPVRAGDECLVVFSDRCIDFWWQNGGVQETVDPRMHDLSDAFAIVGPQSQAKKISGISTTSVQVRTDDGASFIELKQGGSVNITTPLLTVNGDVQVHGAISSTGDQVANGISQTGHKHGGVQSGGSSTGGPQ